MTRPLLSVIVPTYGRAEHIGPLIDSVLAQEMQDWEFVVAEDASPRRDEVRAVVESYRERIGPRIRFHQNPECLGYDGNFRKLIELATGQFVFVMGDDDRVAPGAFAAVARAIAKYPNMGVIIRAYAMFSGTLDNVTRVIKHWPNECMFAAGPQAIVAAHRRLVAMAGIVMHRDSAQACATDRFDGSLFYQMWLSSNILVTRDAVYIPDILAYFRMNSAGVFGTSARERAHYTPGKQPPEMDVKMIRWLFDIADVVERERGIPVAEQVRRDYANHIYPTLKHQAHVPRAEFHRYYHDLGNVGLNKYWQYHAWYWAIAILGIRPLDWIIKVVRGTFGYSPNLTRFVRPTQRSPQR